MNPWRSISSGLRSILRRDKVEREIDDELTHYFQESVREHERTGLTPAAATRAARVEMGSLAGAREQALAGGWETRVESVLKDVRHSVRSLVRSPGFTAVAVATLALGVGAATTMFSVVNAVMLRPLPWRDAGRLALVWTDDVKRSLHREPTAYRTIVDWRDASRGFKSIAFFTTQRVAPRSNDPGGERGRSRTAYVSGNLFDTLGVRPAVGRAITADDEATRTRIAVISDSFWRRCFGSAPDILGRTVSFDDSSKQSPGDLTIVGVMPPDFYFPDRQTEIWVPATIYWRFTRESTERLPEWARRWTAVARLADGASMSDAQADLARIGRQLASVHMSTEPDFPGFRTTAIPVLDAITGASLQTALWLLMGAVSLVMLVACVNVANLLLARGASRHHEIAVRRALGASRGRIVQGLVIENLILACAGGAAGTLFATWGTRMLGVAASGFVPRINEITMDASVLAFALAASIVAGLTFGLVPALRLSSADANEALKDGGHDTGRRRVRRSRDFLVVVECAAAVVLLTGAGLLLRSLGLLQAVEPGFDPSHVLAVRFEMPSDPPPAPDANLQTSRSEPARAATRDALARRLQERVSALAGVMSVGYVDDLFVAGQGRASITIPGVPDGAIRAGELNQGAVSAGFFAALRVPLLSGRFLSSDDTRQRIRALWQLVVTDMPLDQKERLAIAEPVVVNESFVQRFLPGMDPIGRKFCTDPANKTYWYEIVGVVGDMHRSGLERRAIPEYYGPWFPSPDGRADLLVRTSGDPLAQAAAIRNELTQAIPGVSVVTVSTVDAGLGDFSALRRLQTTLLTIFALVALTLAAVGIFALVHFSVAERTREIGVRVAMGATRAQIMGLVLGQGLRSPGLGILLGIAASLGATRILTSSLFGVKPTDPITFAAVAAVLALVAAVACGIAGRRALRIDPIRALREA